jgi:ParB family chromosome partitioning protein
MNSDGQKRNLGRGLSALLGGQAAAEPTVLPRSLRTLPIEQLSPGPFQPRQRFDQTELEALADSIRENGVLQPVLVRPRPGQPGSFEIVAGERRWRAAQIARLHEVPVLIRELNDQEALQLAIVENIQRENLSPLEEARGYKRLIEEFANTQDDLAQHVGKSRSHIANTLRLLDLPSAVQVLLEDGRLTAGHARALIGTPDPSALAKLVVDRGLNVRQTERLAKFGRRPAAPRARTEKDADTRALERDLTAQLGLHVAIAAHGEAGHVTIQYRTLEQLDLIAARLRGGAPH